VYTIALLPISFFFRRKRRLCRTHKLQYNKIKYNTIIKYILVLQRYINGYIRFTLFQVAKIPSHHIRNFLYKKIYGVQMAQNSIIYFGAEIRSPERLIIGKGTIIGDNAILDARNGIEIGENVNLSSKVSIWTEQHDHRDTFFRCNSNSKFSVKLGHRVWLGPNVTLLPGVEIGEGAVVAAGAIVTKNVEPFSIVAGIPAKKIGDRNRNLQYIFHGIYHPFL
jgi:acetyltransferase-like isoleucine patch superfamily enzyme